MRRLHLNHVLSKMERRQAWASFARRSARCGGWIGLISAIIDQQHSLPLNGGQEDDAGSFQSPAHLIARCLVHIESAFGFEAFKPTFSK